MQKFKLILTFTVFSIMITGCQTVKEKTDAIVEKENEKYEKYLENFIKKLLIYKFNFQSITLLNL